jgi:DNA (cytosine-5)-methyltransferase 1
MNSNQSDIPVIDLFAGPGGLAEGFSSLNKIAKQSFRICLSVEKDLHAHRTLETRCFFRQFPLEEVPNEYYSYLRQEITREHLFDLYPSEAQMARNEAWCAELGSFSFPSEKVDDRILKALGNSKKWVLIGGPPCQAYSTVGRSRNKGIEGYVPEEDKRHFLYREYLRIISKHWPTVFVMENVKGLLSARINGNKIFDHILQDLHDPLSAIKIEQNGITRGYKYRIYSLVKPTYYPFTQNLTKSPQSDYLIMGENYGIPQARHRLILLGIREDLGEVSPVTLSPQKSVSTDLVLDGLPALRSGLSREEDGFDNWKKRVCEIVADEIFSQIYDEKDKDIWKHLRYILNQIKLSGEKSRGKEYLPIIPKCYYKSDWYIDPKLKGVCNHTTKAHMTEDLHRYIFASCFASVRGRSPTLPEFPKKLWPAHKNAHKARRSGTFSDRFRVQLGDKPATTIMSHISKDGHYYIHYDPIQCRSLTVREAARLQTFPDNYFFEGPRTQQYIQVGNAVPPLLAFQIAKIVYDVLKKIP